MSTIAIRYHFFLVDTWRTKARVYRKVRDIVRGILSWLGYSSRLPPTPQDKIVSPQWLSSVLGSMVTSIKTNDLAENRGFVGGMTVLDVETTTTSAATGATSAKRRIIPLILKTSQPEISSRMAGLGGVREAMYYSSKYAQEPTKEGRIPKTFYSHGSARLIEMVVLMEDLQRSNNHPDDANKSVGVNQLLGNQIWGVSDDTPKNIDKMEVLKAMYYHAAEMHAQFWMDNSLLKERWMRNANWYNGRDRQYWELTMKAARHGWEKVRAHPHLKYPKGFVEVVDASFARSSWDQVQEHLRSAPFTLTHGDFHAANMILQVPSEGPCNADELLKGLKIFDWSEVGPWEPATDLAQTVISDLPRDLFDKVEEALKAYHVRLQELGVRDYSWEDCRRRFGESGMERWIWVVGIMSDLFDITSTGLGQYFIDQMDAFRRQFCPERTHFVLKTCGYVLPSRE